MQIRKVKYDKAIQAWAKGSNKSQIESVSGRLISYYADEDRKIRVKEKHLCKFCYYYAKDRIGGCAITSVICGNCNEVLTFSNTNTDKLCESCAEELKACKHCGQKMD